MRIDADRRLVEQEHLGVVEQRRGEVEAPLHAAAERPHLVPGTVRQADQIEPLARGPAGDLAIEVVKSREEE